MPSRKATAGVGSNQYQTRPPIPPLRPPIPPMLVADDDEHPEQVAWAFDPDRRRRWAAVGVRDWATAHQWTAHGFEPETAGPWRNVGFDPPTAGAWQQHWSGSATLGSVWLDAGWDDPAEAEVWYQLEWTGGHKAGRPWRAAGFSPAAADAWRRAGFDPTSASWWQSAGFAAAEALAWRNAAATQAQPMIDWATRMRAAGFTPDTARRR